MWHQGREEHMTAGLWPPCVSQTCCTELQGTVYTLEASLMWWHLQLLAQWLDPSGVHCLLSFFLQTSQWHSDVVNIQSSRYLIVINHLFKVVRISLLCVLIRSLSVVFCWALCWLCVFFFFKQRCASQSIPPTYTLLHKAAEHRASPASCYWADSLERYVCWKTPRLYLWSCLQSFSRWDFNQFLTHANMITLI